MDNTLQMKNDLQKEVTEWAENTFGKSTRPNGKVLHLFDELEEAFAECIFDRQREEIADAAMILLHLASFLEVDITKISPEFEEAIRRKFEICKTRKWARREDGQMHHVKEV